MPLHGEVVSNKSKWLCIRTETYTHSENWCQGLCLGPHLGWVSHPKASRCNQHGDEPMPQTDPVLAVTAAPYWCPWAEKSRVNIEYEKTAQVCFHGKSFGMELLLFPKNKWWSAVKQAPHKLVQSEHSVYSRGKWAKDMSWQLEKEEINERDWLITCNETLFMVHRLMFFLVKRI